MATIECPKCGEDIEIEFPGDKITCEECGTSYYITNRAGWEAFDGNTVEDNEGDYWELEEIKHIESIPMGPKEPPSKSNAHGFAICDVIYRDGHGDIKTPCSFFVELRRWASVEADRLDYVLEVSYSNKKSEATNHQHILNVTSDKDGVEIARESYGEIVILVGVLKRFEASRSDN